MINGCRGYKVFIFLGHFGSGKTEVAANFAYELLKHEDKVSIIDMDIVNPFFRTQDLRKEFEELGINVVSSAYAGTNVEISALPSIIPRIIQESGKVVIDVGGDDVGAKAIATYREYILNEDYYAYCVVNTRRPATDSAEKIQKMISQIEKSSKIKINSIVNNTNISNLTTIEEVLEGQGILEEVSNKIGVPIGFVCANSNVINEMDPYLKESSLEHKLVVKIPWM